MAWFGEGFSSLKGQLSNLAKNVLVEEEEQSKSSDVGLEGPSLAVLDSETTQIGSGWSEATEDTFIGQDVGEEKQSDKTETKESPATEAAAQPSKSTMEKEMGISIPKGIAQFFHQMGGSPQQSTENKRRSNRETQTEPDIIAASEENAIEQIREQNVRLTSEINSLRRVIRDLESQIALSQDENANLSTGLEELDIQHQEAIERILNVKEETHKELEQVKEQLTQKMAEVLKVTEENEKLNQQVELLNLELMGCETLSQENAHLRERIGELVKAELPSIAEQSAAEEHVRSLEAEVAALRESRDNLERESASLLLQVRQRDANLQQVDARLEEITNEKEIKEREMTQIVFECNSLKEELKNATGTIESLDNVNLSLRENCTSLQNKLDESSKEIETLKMVLEASKREISISKDESETLKAELESLKEDIGIGEAKAYQGCQELEQARMARQEESLKVEGMQKKILDLEQKLSLSSLEMERNKVNFEAERENMQKKLDELRDLSREYGIQKDIFKEKEVELKLQLGGVDTELANVANQLLQTAKERDDLKLEVIRLTEEKELQLQTWGDKDKEITKQKDLAEELQKEISRLTNEMNDIVSGNKNKDDEIMRYKLKLENDIDKYKETIKCMETKISDYDTQLSNLNDLLKNKTDEQEVKKLEDITKLIDEKNKQSLEIQNLSKKVEELLKNQQSNDSTNKELEEKLKVLSSEKDKILEEKRNFEKVNQTLLSEVASITNKNQHLNDTMEKLQSHLEEVKSENGKLTEQVKIADNDKNVYSERLKIFGGIEGVLSKINQSEKQLEQLSHQVDHFKDELREAYDEKSKLASDYSIVASDKNQLLEQVEILRKELGTIPALKEEVDNLKHNLQMKTAETLSLGNEIKRISTALNVQLSNNELMYKEKVELSQKYEELHIQMQSKMSSMEEIEKAKTKEVEMLKQEVENLKTQLEYASQLLKNVERQEGEGQPSGESNSQKASSELQEEITRLSASLLKEQTNCKLLKNQLEESKEKLEKAENQLRTLKSHLVEIQDSYSSELSAAEDKLRDTQTQLMTAEERARTSSTAYTSASIRANQQVESLREQLRLLTEHKEKLEQQLSQSEDSSLKQSAAITRLQAVLHQFHIDKQKDVDFETERIRRDLKSSEKKYEDLLQEMKVLQEQLYEAKKGLAAGQKLSEDLLRQSDLITQLKSEIYDLKEKLKLKEEKMNDLNSDNKVDRQLVKNLLVGYVVSPVESKSKVLGVLGQVLSLSKEERQKVGLEPGGRQQSLSEAFIKFLQSESQPRNEVILPLAVTQPDQPPSRKSSLLTPDVPVLPHFTVGRNPGSILKDVLQERRPE